MKILILYTSRYGCTKDCAEYLRKGLNHESKIADLQNPGMIDLQQYDWIIIGSPIYIGKTQKEARIFCEGNLQKLLKKNIILFICCTTPEQVNDYFKNNFPAQLLDHSIETINFGGELRQYKMKFIDRKITSMVSKLAPKQPKILYENIDLLSNLINTKANE